MTDAKPEETKHADDVFEWVFDRRIERSDISNRIRDNARRKVNLPD